MIGCPHCEGPVQYLREQAGRAVSCPYCGKFFIVPAIAEPEPPPVVATQAHATIRVRGMMRPEKREPSMLSLFLQVVLGGLGGIALAMLIIWLLGMDPWEVFGNLVK